jgi:hypothetical protein
MKLPLGVAFDEDVCPGSDFKVNSDMGLVVGYLIAHYL